MKFFRLLPEVAGEIGEKSIIKYQNGMIDSVEFLHYVFYGWLGDELLTQTPCYIVSRKFADMLEKSSLTGYKFEKIMISKSDEFRQLYPDVDIPEFVRLLPYGVVKTDNNRVVSWSGHDICLEDDIELVITERAFDVFSQYNKHCEFETLET